VSSETLVLYRGRTVPKS